MCEPEPTFLLVTDSDGRRAALEVSEVSSFKESANPEAKGLVLDHTLVNMKSQYQVLVRCAFDEFTSLMTSAITEPDEDERPQAPEIGTEPRGY